MEILLLKLIVTFLSFCFLQAEIICSLNSTVVDIPTCPTNLTFHAKAKGYQIQNETYNHLNVIRVQTATLDENGTLTCTNGNLPDEVCAANLNNNTAGLTYGGDSKFCLNRTCVEYPDCFCQHLRFSEVLKWVENGITGLDAVTAGIDINYALDMNHSAEYKPDPNIVYSFLIQNTTAPIENRRRNVIFEQEPTIPVDLVYHPNPDSVTVILSKGVLIVTFTEVVTRTLSIIKNPSYQVSLSVDNTNRFAFTLPSSILEVSGWLQITVWNEGLVSYYGTQEIVGVTTCRLHDCLFCYDAVSNWRCLSTYYKFVLIIVAIVLVLFVIGCCGGLLLWIGKVVWMLLLIPFYYVPTWCKNLRKTPAAKWANEKAQKTAKYFVPSSEEDVENISPRRGRGGKPGRAMILTVALALAMAEALPTCDLSTTETMSIVSCVTGVGGIQTCSGAVDVNYNFPSSGRTHCVAFSDPSDSSVYYMASLQYIATFDQILYSDVYYTSAFDAAVQYSMRCKNAGSCTGSNCAQLNGVTNRNCYGELTAINATQYPGRSRCTNVDPNVGQCFYLSNGCMFSGYGLVPSGTVGLVRRINIRQLKHSFNFTLWKADGSIDFTKAVEIIGSASFGLLSPNDATFSLGFAAAYQTSVPDFTSRQYHLTLGEASFIGPASEPGFPVPGKIGDIQGTTVSSFSTVSPNAFVFSTSQVKTFSADSTSARYVFETASLKNPSNLMSKLPTAIAGVNYDLAGGMVQGRLSGQDPMTLTLVSGEPLTFQRVANIVCPDGTLTSVSGCYDCDIGASAALKLKTTCMNGAVTVAADVDYVTVLTSVLIINSTLSTYMVYFETTQASNTFNLLIGDLDQILTIPISFTAVENITIPQTNNTANNGTDAGDNNKTNPFTDFFTKTLPQFFKDIFDGIASWWEYLIFVLIAVVILLGAFIGFKVLYKVYKMRALRKQVKKVN